MYDLATIEKIQRDAIRRSRAHGKTLYQAQSNGDRKVFGCPASPLKVKGFTLVNKYFVDNSGFGSSTEPALTASDFLSRVKEGFYYGIVEQGQFQIYIGEFTKN